MLIKGRQWYITRESLLFVQFRQQDVKDIPFYRLGVEAVGIFPDERTMFKGIVVARTKTGLLLNDWSIYGSTDGVSKN